MLPCPLLTSLGQDTLRYPLTHTCVCLTFGVDCFDCRQQISGRSSVTKERVFSHHRVYQIGFTTRTHAAPHFSFYCQNPPFFIKIFNERSFILCQNSIFMNNQKYYKTSSLSSRTYTNTQRGKNVIHRTNPYYDNLLKCNSSSLLFTTSTLIFPRIHFLLFHFIFYYSLTSVGSDVFLLIIHPRTEK